MRVELTGHQVDISPGLRNLVDRKLAKVHRVLNDAGVSASVVVKKEKVQNVVEITLHARGERFMHAAGKAETWQTAMTAAVSKLMHQTEKVKGVWQERKRRGARGQAPRAWPRSRTRSLRARRLDVPERAARRADQLPRRPMPLRGLLCERALEDLVERSRQLGAALTGARWRNVQVGVEHRPLRASAKRRRSGESLEQHRAERVDLAAAARRRAADLLR